MAKIDIKGPIVSDEDKWIYEWFDIPAVCPKDVSTVLSKLKGEELEVDINSGGGDVFAAIEISELLRGYKGNVMRNCVGLAGSAASIILASGRNRISISGMVMIHNTSGSSTGDYHAMDKSSEILQKANKAIVNIYIEKTGMSQEELLALMDKETWMTADEAIKLHFVDEIMENQNQNFSKAANAINNRSLFAIYNSVPILDKKVIEKARALLKKPLNNENYVPVIANTIRDDNEEHFFNKKINRKEGNQMADNAVEIRNADQLRATYPELVKQIEDNARAEATAEERNRLKAIDEIAGTLTDEIVNNAKYVKPITAEVLALQALKANSQLGNKILNQMVDDIEKSGANDIKSSGNSGYATADAEAKEAKIKGLAAKLARNNIIGGKK